MISDAQNVIAEVIGKHRLENGMRMGRGERVEWWECLECGWRSEEFDLDDSEVRREIERVKRAHVASEVDKALGVLTREQSWRVGGVRGLVLDSTDVEDAEVIARRWVSGWSEA